MKDMGGGFFEITWIVVFAIVIIAVVWIVKSDKKKMNQTIEIAKERLVKGEITQEEYEKLMKEIRKK